MRDVHHGDPAIGRDLRRHVDNDVDRKVLLVGAALSITGLDDEKIDVVEVRITRQVEVWTDPEADQAGDGIDLERGGIVASRNGEGNDAAGILIRSGHGRDRSCPLAKSDGSRTAAPVRRDHRSIVGIGYADHDGTIEAEAVLIADAHDQQLAAAGFEINQVPVDHGDITRDRINGEAATGIAAGCKAVSQNRSAIGVSAHDPAEEKARGSILPKRRIADARVDRGFVDIVDRDQQRLAVAELAIADLDDHLVGVRAIDISVCLEIRCLNKVEPAISAIDREPRDILATDDREDQTIPRVGIRAGDIGHADLVLRQSNTA